MNRIERGDRASLELSKQFRMICRVEHEFSEGNRSAPVYIACCKHVGLDNVDSIQVFAVWGNSNWNFTGCSQMRQDEILRLDFRHLVVCHILRKQLLPHQNGSEVLRLRRDVLFKFPKCDSRLRGLLKEVENALGVTVNLRVLLDLLASYVVNFTKEILHFADIQQTTPILVNAFKEALDDPRDSRLCEHVVRHRLKRLCSLRVAHVDFFLHARNFGVEERICPRIRNKIMVRNLRCVGGPRGTLNELRGMSVRLAKHHWHAIDSGDAFDEADGCGKPNGRGSRLICKLHEDRLPDHQFRKRSGIVECVLFELRQRERAGGTLFEIVEHLHGERLDLASSLFFPVCQPNLCDECAELKEI
mmetsp:Transcript_29271/g.95394  ORF Transcript_29271/g.95394 Transcript_29271/m.95394 type:complete len:360 (+) Transcript_29271:3357-4436(+)